MKLLPSRPASIGLLLFISLVVAACGGGSSKTLPPPLPPAVDAVVATVAVGPQPWGVAITPDGTQAWVGNSGNAAGGGTVSVISLASRTVTSTIVSRAGAADVIFNAAGTRAYVTNYFDQSISDIDTSNHSVVVNSARCGGPLALSREMFGNRIVFACDSYVQSLDVTTLAVSGTTCIAVGDIVARASTSSWVYVDKSANQLVQYDFNTGGRTHPWGNTFADGLQTLALSSDGQLGVAGSTAAGVLTFLDMTNNTVLATLTIGGAPRGIAFNPSGTKVYAVDNTGNRVVVVDVASRTVLSTLSVGNGALRIAISPDGRTAVVTNNDDGTVSIIALAP